MGDNFDKYEPIIFANEFATFHFFFISPWPFFYSKRPPENVVYGFSLDNKIFDFVLEDGDLKICLVNDGRSDDIFRQCAIIPLKYADFCHRRVMTPGWHLYPIIFHGETNANRSGLSSLKKSPRRGGLCLSNN